MALSIVNTANLKSGVATLLTLHANDLSLQWLNKSTFILSDKPSVNNNGSIWLFNSQGGGLTPLVFEESGLEGIWSHGTKTTGLVFSDSPSGQSQPLLLESVSTSLSSRSLTFSTLPSKCLFNNDSSSTATSSAYLALYCGIPRPSSNFASAHLPDDYNMMALFTSDDIYKVNTVNGQTQTLWSSQSQNVDASNLKIFNNTLFFVNRYNQELYGLVLSQ